MQPAIAHLTPELRRQIRAQQNRESAKETRLHKKQQALDLEESVWTLHDRNKKCKRGFEELEEMTRGVDQEAQAYAKEGADEGATKVFEAVNDCRDAAQACNRSCHRTF